MSDFSTVQIVQENRMDFSKTPNKIYVRFNNFSMTDYTHNQYNNKSGVFSIFTGQIKKQNNLISLIQITQFIF